MSWQQQWQQQPCAVGNCQQSTSSTTSSSSSSSSAGGSSIRRVPHRWQRCVALIWLCCWLGKLRFQPPLLFLQLVTKAALHQLHTFSCSDVGVLFWGLARLRHGCNHQHWVRPMLDFPVRLWDDCVSGAPAISNVVHALPLLPPSRKNNTLLKQRLGLLLPQLAAAQDRLAEMVDRGSWCSCWKGFARLGFRPSDDWVLSHEREGLELGFEQFSARERQILSIAWEKIRRLPSPDPCYGCMLLLPQVQEQQQQQQQQDRKNQLMLAM